MALRLQQALVDVPLSKLRSESFRTFLYTLCSRFDVNNSDDLQQQFLDLLTSVYNAKLGFWICDYVACVCADDSISSSDPEDFYLLQPQGVLSWCESSAAELQKRVLGLFQSGAAAAQPDYIIDLGHATRTLLSVAQAVEAALGSSSEAASGLTSSLQLLHQTTQVLQWLEQLQQQRPGLTPLITRSASSSRTDGPARLGLTAGASPKPCPAHTSMAAWQQSLAAARQAAPGARLFLDDLLDQLLVTSAGQRALLYPFPDVLSAVEFLFMSGSSGSGGGAWHAKLAVLLYYLLDGGWLASAAPFAQGFQLPLTMVQQWQCHYLLDAAQTHSGTAAAGAAAAAGGAAAGKSPLDEACSLLGAIACPATPFRFVEALLAAGRPTTALAVQRARCAASSSSSSSSSSVSGTSLSEALVLLRVQLGSGLLPEAFSEMRRHCSQLSGAQRFSHVKALMHQLAAWAATAAAADPPQQQQQQQHQLSRLQQLCQLPLDCAEEAALLAWYRQRMAAGQPGGHMLPLYLLQRGRSLEALSAYAEYQASPAAGGAAGSNSGSDGGGAAAAALLQRQLHTLMSAAAAALPPSLRATAIATDPSAGAATAAAARPVLSGVGGFEAEAAGACSVPVAVLSSRGIEPPVFMSQLIPAAPGGDGGDGYRGGGGLSGLSVVGVGVGAAGSGDATAAAEEEGVDGAAAAEDGAEMQGVQQQQQAAQSKAAAAGGYMGSLFGREVLAEAGPGSVVLSKPQGLTGGQAGGVFDAGSDFVPLLFGTPAPAAAGGPGFRGGQQSGPNAAASTTPGGVGGFSMSKDEFGQEVLGIKGSQGSAAAGTPGGGYGEGGGSRRSSKRQRQTPGRLQPGAGGR